MSKSEVARIRSDSAVTKFREPVVNENARHASFISSIEPFDFRDEAGIMRRDFHFFGERIVSETRGETSALVFVSQANEDKNRFVREFATKLRDNGIRAWLDK